MANKRLVIWTIIVFLLVVGQIFIEDASCPIVVGYRCIRPVVLVSPGRGQDRLSESVVVSFGVVCLVVTDSTHHEPLEIVLGPLRGPVLALVFT